MVTIGLTLMMTTINPRRDVSESRKRKSRQLFLGVTVSMKKSNSLNLKSNYKKHQKRL